MEKATNPTRVALVLSRRVLARLAGGLTPLVGPGRDFGVIDLADDPARVVERLLDWQPAGVIMEFREELTEAVASLGRPVVVVMADLLMEGMGVVNVDDAAVGRLAARYLWDKGLRRFGFLGRETLHAPERRTGFAGELAGRGCAPACLERGPQHGPAAARLQRERLDAWLAALPRPAGVFAAHDPLGPEVLEACRRLGLRVPEDVAVLAASDDPFACELVHPGISSVEIPWQQIGLEAARLLDAMLAGALPGEPVLVPPGRIRTRPSTDYHAVSDPRVQRALRHMQAHLHQPALDIPAVARAAALDRRALERLFRAQLARSPKAVLTGMRVARARELLEQTRLRVGEIAERCGFRASEQLAAAFRARFGTTPRQWRKL